MKPYPIITKAWRLNPCVLALLCFLISCSTSTGKNDGTLLQYTLQDGSELYFLRQKRVPSEVGRMTARLDGRLVSAGGCLRIATEYEVDGGNDVTPVWPSGYTLQVNEGQVRLLDNYGAVVGRLSEIVVLGGGFVPDTAVTDFVDSVPDECPGPYFIVGG